MKDRNTFKGSLEEGDHCELHGRGLYGTLTFRKKTGMMKTLLEIGDGSDMTWTDSDVARSLKKTLQQPSHPNPNLCLQSK